jgi:hypothetical protein
MEEIKLPTVPELSLIPIERRNFPEADHKREKRKIQRKNKEGTRIPDAGRPDGTQIRRG